MNQRLGSLSRSSSSFWSASCFISVQHPSSVMRELWKPKKTCYFLCCSSNTCLTVVNQIFWDWNFQDHDFSFNGCLQKKMTRYFVRGRLTDHLQEDFIISMMMMMFWSECWAPDHHPFQLISHSELTVLLLVWWWWWWWQHFCRTAAAAATHSVQPPVPHTWARSICTSVLDLGVGFCYLAQVASNNGLLLANKNRHPCEVETYVLFLLLHFILSLFL